MVSFKVVLESLIDKVTVNIINKDLLFGNKKPSVTENNKGLIKDGREARAHARTHTHRAKAENATIFSNGCSSPYLLCINSVLKDP